MPQVVHHFPFHIYIKGLGLTFQFDCRHREGILEISRYWVRNGLVNEILRGALPV
jgi:hypothetical protein